MLPSAEPRCRDYFKPDFFNGIAPMRPSPGASLGGRVAMVEPTRKGATYRSKTAVKMPELVVSVIALLP